MPLTTTRAPSKEVPSKSPNTLPIALGVCLIILGVIYSVYYWDRDLSEFKGYWLVAFVLIVGGVIILAIAASNEAKRRKNEQNK